MVYLKGVLSAIAGVVVALFGPWIVWAILHGNGQQAIVLGSITGSIRTPTFWALALALFGVFFVASRAASRVPEDTVLLDSTTVAIAFGAAVTSW